MKKIILTCLFLSSCFALAQLNQGGFVDGHSSESQPLKIVSPYDITKVSETQILPEDSFITLEGHLAGPDTTGKAADYIFKDPSGSIRVNIDNKLWRGQIVTPDTKIKLLGQLVIDAQNENRSVQVKYLAIID